MDLPAPFSVKRKLAFFRGHPPVVLELTVTSIEEAESILKCSAYAGYYVLDEGEACEEGWYVADTCKSPPRFLPPEQIEAETLRPPGP